MRELPTDPIWIDANGCLTERRWIGGQEVIVHHDDLPESDRTVIDGIPVTTALRTVIDIAPDVEADHLQRILDDALNRRELVEHAFNLHGGHRGAFDRRQQHAPQRVADRRAEPPLERLRVEAPEPVGQCFTLELEPLRTLKTLPQHCLHVLSRSGSHPRAGQTCRFTPRLPPQVWKAAGGELA